jgi:hypothetical protein
LSAFVLASACAQPAAAKPTTRSAASPRSTSKLRLFDEAPPYAFTSGAPAAVEELAGKWMEGSPDRSHGSGSTSWPA